MKQLSKPVYIVAAKRTAFGTFGGTLKDLSAVELGAIAAKAALNQLGPNAASVVDSVCVGNVAQSTSDCAYLSRHVALKAGVDVSVPCLTVNRLCGSGFQSIITGTQEICNNESSVVLTGGAESMSLAPFTVHGIRWGVPLNKGPQLVDSLWETLTDNYKKMPMAITAENLAEKFGITKEMSDQAAFESQQKWKVANDKGLFKNEITPVHLKVKGKDHVFEVDEHPKPATTLEKLGSLKPLFKKDGCVSAGNASGISDGAGAVVVANEEAMTKNNWKPLSRIVSYAVCGVPPEIMGHGPVPAINMALKKAGLSLKDMDLIEINEAFACQFLACSKDLKLDMSKANLNGGAVAMGHPTGASGSRIMGHLTYELQRTGKKYAVGAACIGGGQGVAIIIERC